MTFLGGDAVGAAFVEIHAVPSPALEAEAAAIAARTAATVQGSLTPAVAKAGKGLNTAALGIVAALGLIGKKAVDTFSGTVEAMNVVDVAFRDNAKGVKKWATGLSSSFGLTNRGILETAGNFGLLFDNAGLGIEASTQLAQALTERAADLSSLFNISGATAIDKLTSGILGEARAARSLGLDLSDAAVGAEAFRLGIADTSEELSQGQKIVIRARLALEQSTEAQGDAIRTAATFEGRLRTLRGEIGDLSERVGKDLVPSLGLVGKGLEIAVKDVNALPDPVRAVAVNTAALGTAAVAASFAWQKLAPAVLGVRNALGVAASTVELAGGLLLDLGAVALLGPVGAVAGIIALGHATGPAAVGLKELGAAVGDTGRLIDQFFTFADREHGQGIFETGLQILGFNQDLVVEQKKDLIQALDDIFAQNPELARRIVEAAEADASGFGAAYAETLREELIRLQPTLPDIKVPVSAEVNLEAFKAGLSAINGLFSSTDAVADANRSLAGATIDVGKAQAAVNALLKVGAAQEIADQRERLADATDSVAGALRRQAEAQAALDKLNAPATDRELSDATDAVAEAQIGVARATRARDEAQRALLKTTGRSLNLAGLSLDQLRTTLAVERATLATKRAGTAKGDPAVLAENVVEAEISLRKAKETVADAQAALLTLQNKGKVATDETEAAERDLEDAKRATIRAQKDQQTEERALASLLAGNSQFAKDLKAAQEAVANAKERERDAAKLVGDAVAKQRDDVHAILGDLPLITEELQRQLNLHPDIGGDIATRRAIVASVLGVAGVSSLTGGGDLSTILSHLSDSLITEMFNALKSNPKALVDLLKQLGFTVPGHALGGLVTRPELAWLGEKSRPELILPLSDPARTWNLLARHLPEFTIPRTLAADVTPIRRPASGPPSGLPSEAPMTKREALRIIALLERIERKAGAAPDIDINVAATDGMDEARLVRKTVRELRRYWS